jgi:ABC-type glutathione transport system ATPase component
VTLFLSSAGRGILLELVNIAKIYRTGAFGTKVNPAIVDASLSLGRGESVGLTGESGCGKSTLARIAVKLIRPSGGRIFIDRVDVTDLSERRFRPYRKRIQIIFQHPESALNPYHTLRASLEEALFKAGIPKESHAAHLEKIAETVSLPPDILDRHPGQVSGGEIQRAVLARVLSMKPEYLIMDEPTSMLDVSIQAQIMQTVKRNKDRDHTGILLISHDLDLIRASCDRVLVMTGGRIVESGSIDRVFLHPEHHYTRFLLESAR